MFKIKRLPAFSLIEVAVVLIILGVILGLTIPLVTSSQKISQHKITESRQHQVVQSIAAYVLQHSKFPGAAAQSDGKISPCHQSDICMGYVPYRDLGLPESVARDGNGHWMSYAIHCELTRTGVNADATTEKICRVSKRVFRIKSSITRDDLVASSTDPVAFVLISHGDQGRGALLDSGDRIPSAGQEAENSQGSPDFYDGRSPDNSHHLFWVTRNNFMATYAKNPCNPDGNIGQGYSRNQHQTSGRL